MISKIKKAIHDLYRFLPVQLVLLHGRKYQLLLLFWLILFLTVKDKFASHFGASTLFLAPEYLGKINFVSMMLLGAGVAIFIMSWHITTFIIHSSRMPFIGASKQAFLKYCINNSLIPLVFLVFYSIESVRYQHYENGTSWLDVILFQCGFYLGVQLTIFVNFAYFFRVGRGILKSALAAITDQVSHLSELIPHDHLDFEREMIQAETFLTETFKLKHRSQLENYHPKFLIVILRRHQTNALAAAFFSLVLLLVLGIFMEQPLLRLPAGAGIFIFFSVTMSAVGALKYYLRSWEMLGWVGLIVLLGWLVRIGVFDLRSIAYGMDYSGSKQEIPDYNYDQLKEVFSTTRYFADKDSGIAHLEAWKRLQPEKKPPLVVVTVSGGGSRSAYWTLRALQYADSMSGGMLFKRTALITGASGGMIGAASWRNLHLEYLRGTIKNPYDTKFLDDIGKDLLNAVIFSLAAVDLISPFNKIQLKKYTYTKDRGYAFEQELKSNSEGIISKRLSYFKPFERQGAIPQLIVNGSIVNDGRKLMMSTLPVAYLTRPIYSANDTVTPVIDAVDFATFFAKQDPYNMRLLSALRMSATFPYILPVVKLPSKPKMNVMDAGLRDNFGVELTSRWLSVFRDWLDSNTSEVIWLQIRDTREYHVLPASSEFTLGDMLTDPLFVIQNKWELFQSNAQSYIKDYTPDYFKGKMRFINVQYITTMGDQSAKLNFHLTRKEQEDLYKAISVGKNKLQIDTLTRIIKRGPQNP